MSAECILHIPWTILITFCLKKMKVIFFKAIDIIERGSFATPSNRLMLTEVKILLRVHSALEKEPTTVFA